MAVVHGTPLQALADAIYQHLAADADLLALATGGVVSSLPKSTRTARPYVVVGNRELIDNGLAGAMGHDGGQTAVTVDVFSGFDGPEETQTIQARIRQLLMRTDLTVTGYALYGGSLTCEDERVLPDFDPDMPQRSGFHGVQRWIALIEDAWV